ncbi:MAG: oligosaccharide flippase family protein [Vicinamibacterales bacterium]
MKLLSGSVTARAAFGRPSSWRIVLKTAADAAGKGAMLAITIVAARRLDGESFGVFALAMTSGWLLGVASDAGWSMYLARHTARHPAFARATALAVLMPRTAAAGVALVAASVVAARTVPGPWLRGFLLVTGAQLAGAVLDTIGHLFRGLGRSEVEATLHAAQRALAIALVLLAVWMRPDLDALGAALLAPPLLAIAVALPIAASVAPRRPGRAARTFGAIDAAAFVRDVLPIGVATLVSALYFRCGVFFVEHWHGLDAAGDYNAVFRLVEAIRLFPAAVLAVTFPVLCRATSLDALRSLASMLTLAGLAIVPCLLAGATVVVTTVYGDAVLPAIPALRVLAIAVPLFFLNYALTHQVIGWDGHRAYLGVAMSALGANLAASLWLVPAMGLVGAALATVITEAVVTVGCLYVLRTSQLPEAVRAGTA